MQMKNSRNAQTAREVYSLADMASKFFELMTIKVPECFGLQLREIRLRALQTLYVEELQNGDMKETPRQIQQEKTEENTIQNQNN